MDARVLKDEAADLFRKGKFAKAADAYLQLIKLEPKEVQHRIKMGDAHRRDGKKEQAIEAYRKAVDDYIKSGIVIKAIAACKLILEIDPNQRDAQEALATLCSKRYVKRDAVDAPPPPARHATSAARAKPGDAIELPDDDGSEVEIENAGGMSVGPPKKVEPPKPAAGVQIGGRAPVPPTPVRPAPAKPAPFTPAPPKRPDAADSIDIDMDMGEASAPVAPSRARPPAPAPAPEPESGPMEIDLDMGGEAPAAPKPPAERKRGVATYDVSEEADGELLDLVPVVASSDTERRIADTARAASRIPPTPMAEILSDSLLIEGELEEGEEIELVSITTGEDLLTGPHAVARGERPPQPIIAPTPVAPARPPPPPPPPEPEELDLLEPVEEIAAVAKPVAPPPPPAPSMDDLFMAPSEAAGPSAAELAAREAAERAAMERAELARLANDAAFDTGPIPSFEPEPEEPEPAEPLPAIPSGDVAQEKVPIFSELPREAFLDLLEKLDFKRIDAGDVILREGDAGKSIFILATGKAKVVKGHGTDKEIELAVLDDGSFFGEMALLNGAPRVASVVAVEDSEVLELTETLLRDLTTKHPSVAQSLKKFYRQRLLSNVMAISPLFRAFDKSDRKMLVEKFKLREVAANEPIISEGEKPDGLYVVMHGTALVSKLSTDKARQVPLAVLKEGDVFGEMSLLTRKPASATVLAKRKTLVLRLPKAAFDELMFTHPSVLEVVSELTDQRTRVNEQILSGSVEAPREALALV